MSTESTLDLDALERQWREHPDLHSRYRLADWIPQLVAEVRRLSPLALDAARPPQRCACNDDRPTFCSGSHVDGTRTPVCSCIWHTVPADWKRAWLDAAPPLPTALSEADLEAIAEHAPDPLLLFSHLVIRKRELDPVEVWHCRSYEEASRIYDSAAAQWENVYLVTVNRGLRRFGSPDQNDPLPPSDAERLLSEVRRLRVTALHRNERCADALGRLAIDAELHARIATLEGVPRPSSLPTDPASLHAIIRRLDVEVAGAQADREEARKTARVFSEAWHADRVALAEAERTVECAAPLDAIANDDLTLVCDRCHRTARALSDLEMLGVADDQATPWCIACDCELSSAEEHSLEVPLTSVQQDLARARSEIEQQAHELHDEAIEIHRLHEMLAAATFRITKLDRLEALAADYANAERLWASSPEGTADARVAETRRALRWFFGAPEPVPTAEQLREAERMAALGEDFPNTTGTLAHRLGARKD